MLLVAAVHNLIIPDLPGGRIEIADDVYLTNDCRALEQIISPGLRLSMGGNEYLSLIKGTAAAYWKDLPNETDSDRALAFLSGWLSCLRAFFMGLWLLRDNSVNCEMGFIEHHVPGPGLTCGSNFIASPFSTATGTVEPQGFTLSEIRLARDYFQSFFLPLMFGQEVGGSLTTIHSTVQLRGRVVSAKGVHRLPRLLYFLSGARSADDIGVKLSLYMTCLEILFSTEPSELVYRLSERVGVFLSPVPEERLRVYHLVRRAYGVRSKVIHGDVLRESTQKDLASVATEVDHLLRSLIQRIATDRSIRSILDMDNSDLDQFLTALTMGRETPWSRSGD